jgi:hypothetical protein
LKSLQVTNDDDGGGGDYVQLIEFGTVVILFGNIHVKSLLRTEPSRATPLIPVQLANDSF